MTKQNTESENSDINETVVQQPTASETTITSAEAEVTMPANEQDTQTQEIQSKTSEKQIEEEPVRSFTDYIEEFRQKEVQFGSLLDEPQVEPFSALMPGEDPERNEFTPGWTNTPLGDSVLLEGTPIADEEVESHSNTQIVLPVGENGNGAHGHRWFGVCCRDFLFLRLRAGFIALVIAFGVFYFLAKVWPAPTFVRAT